MNKLLMLCVALALIGLFGCSEKSTEPTEVQQNNNSIRLNDFPGIARESAVAFTFAADANKGYIGLGGNSTALIGDFYSYNRVDSTWTVLPPYPGMGRRQAVSFVIGDTAYVGLGYENGQLRNDFKKYSRVSNTWSNMVDFPGASRWSAVGMTIGNKGYVGLGCSADSLNPLVTEFWEYSPTNGSWTRKADFPAWGRKGAIAFGNSTKGYVGLGMRGTLEPTELNVDYVLYNDLWEYSPSNNQWTQKTSCPGKARYCPFAVMMNNSAYIGLGWNMTFLKDIWKYDPASNTWTQMPDFNGSGRSRAACFALNNSIFICSGNGAASDFWKYTP